MRVFGRIREGGPFRAVLSMVIGILILFLFAVQLKEEGLRTHNAEGGRVRRVDMQELLNRIQTGSLSRHKARFFHVVSPEGN